MATVPPAPNQFKITAYTNTTMSGDANSNGDGGSAILQWQVGWSLNPSNFFIPNLADLNSFGGRVITGLDQGATYYFWNRLRNAVGWSNWSPRNQVTLRDVPDPPAAPIFQLKAQDSIRAIVNPNYDGDSPLTGFQLGYGLVNTAPQIVSFGASHAFDLSGLSPGQTYYFWGKATNTYGSSAYSARSSATLIAGAWVKDGGVWKRAVPYVRNGGIWKLARPWGQQFGIWTEFEE